MNEIHAKELVQTGYKEGDMLILYKREAVESGDGFMGPTRYFIRLKLSRDKEVPVHDGFRREVLMESTDAEMLLKAKRLAEGK